MAPMSEAHALMDMDTHPTELLSVVGDRRRAARVAYNGTVRVGRPGGTPSRELSLSDLSLGGLFIDADKPAKIGARFSAEIELEDGQCLYVPEAEVAYNRERSHGSGFGARFVELPKPAARRLELEIQRRCGPAEPSVAPTLSVPPLASEEGTNTDECGDLDDLDIEIQEAIEQAVPAVTLEIPRVRRKASAQRAWLADAREQLRASMARFPSLWVVLMGLGTALLVAALALVIWAEMTRVPQVTVETGQTLGAETHRVLVGEEDPTTLDPHVAPVESLPLKRLDATVEVVPADRPGTADVQDPSGDEAAAHAQVAGSAGSETPAPATRSEPLVPVRAGDEVVLQLAGGTSIRRTLAMKSPHRFVIDVEGLQDYVPGSIDHPKVQSVRFGRHDGFGRIVVDMNTPAQGMKATLRDGELTIRFR